jgi:dihydroorotase
MLEKMTVNPAKLLKIEKGTLDIGADADVTIFDPDRSWVYRRADSASKSLNSPFDGWPMRGKALATIVNGGIVWKEAEF